MHHRITQALVTQILLLILAMLFAYIFFHTGAKPAPGSSPAPAAGTSMYGLAFKDYEGKEAHLYDFRRKPLVVYSWASWCPYCGAEMQHLAEVQAQHGDALQIVAINRGEARVTAKDFTDKFEVSGKVILLLDETDSYFKEIGGYAMPETLYINAAGETVLHTRGPAKNAEIDERIGELVK